MRGSVQTFRALMIPIAVGAVALAGVGVGNPSVIKAEDQMKVEITIKDDGYRAYHIDPGKTMTLTFKKESRPDPTTGISETTQVPFWCDIHTHMKGEFLVVETKGEVGGG